MKMMPMRLPIPRGRTRRPGRKAVAVAPRVLVVMVSAVLALLFGAAAALVGGVPALAVLVALLPLILTFVDYRFGVVALTILLPWANSPLLPQAQGLNIINYFTLASTVSFGAQYVIRRRPMAEFPRILWWCFLVPVSIGMFVAWPHTREGGINLNLGVDEIAGWEPFNYLKGNYIKPLFMVLYAFLLANGVRASKRPERWLAVFAVSALLPVAAVFGLIALYRTPLAELQANRRFMGPLGYHANSMAWLLVTLIGPLVYMTASARRGVRMLLLVPTFGVAVALLLTFSRGGFLGLMVVLAMFAIHRKRVSVFLLIVALVAVSLFAIPAVRERLSTGVEAGALSGGGQHGDKLTAGRLATWPILAREIKRSPIWGRGIGSTAWSEAVRQGLYKPTHPHNLFLLLAMDLGLVGLGLVLYLYYRIGGTFARLSREASLPALTRAFFAGALASLVGSMVVGATTAGFYMPLPEHTYFWFAVGMAMAWWRLGQAEPAGAGTPAQRWTFGIRPLAKHRALTGKIVVR